MVDAAGCRAKERGSWLRHSLESGQPGARNLYALNRQRALHIHPNSPSVPLLPDVEQDNIFRNLPNVQQNSGSTILILILILLFPELTWGPSQNRDALGARSQH